MNVYGGELDYVVTSKLIEVITVFGFFFNISFKKCDIFPNCNIVLKHKLFLGLIRSAIKL